VLEIYQLFESVIEENNFFRRFVRQCLPYVLKTLGVFENSDDKCLNVFDSPHVSFFVLHFVIHRVVDLFKAGYKLDYCWIVGINVVSGLRHLNVRVSCAINILGDFSANYSVRRLYWYRIKISWNERELCSLLSVKKNSFFLYLGL